MTLLSGTDGNQTGIFFNDSKTSSPLLPTTNTRPSLITLSAKVQDIVQNFYSSVNLFNQIKNNDFIICDNNQQKEVDSLSTDPKKWTVIQVGKFLRNITNDVIAEKFLQQYVKNT